VAVDEEGVAVDEEGVAVEEGEFPPGILTRTAPSSNPAAPASLLSRGRTWWMGSNGCMMVRWMGSKCTK
jgi:hypothetical protein